MVQQLKDKVAVVTGASRGIGLAVARALADEGASVVAAARTPGEALAELAATHGLLPVAVDLSTAEGTAELQARTAERFGAVDVLVNNVGTVSPRLGGSLPVTDEQWIETLTTNLLSAVRVTRAARDRLG